jgi:hypothetical protein
VQLQTAIYSAEACRHPLRGRGGGLVHLVGPVPARSEVPRLSVSAVPATPAAPCQNCWLPLPVSPPADPYSTFTAPAPIAAPTPSCTTPTARSAKLSMSKSPRPTPTQTGRRVRPSRAPPRAVLAKQLIAGPGQPARRPYWTLTAPAPRTDPTPWNGAPTAKSTKPSLLKSACPLPAAACATRPPPRPAPAPLATAASPPPPPSGTSPCLAQPSNDTISRSGSRHREHALTGCVMNSTSAWEADGRPNGWILLHVEPAAGCGSCAPYAIWQDRAPVNVEGPEHSRGDITLHEYPGARRTAWQVDLRNGNEPMNVELWVWSWAALLRITSCKCARALEGGTQQ